jgi:hypothetical protein
MLVSGSKNQNSCKKPLKDLKHWKYFYCQSSPICKKKIIFLRFRCLARLSF